MDKIREEFEAWCASIGFTLKPNAFDNGDYAVGYGLEEWNVWKASRAALCVELPDGSLNGLEGGELDKPTMLVIQENKDLKHRCDELLAALDEISKLPSYRQDECSEMARDAIAKANGGAS